MFQKLACVAGASVIALGLMAANAQAVTLLDFTDNDVRTEYNGANILGFAGTTATIETNPVGSLNWNETNTGSTCAGNGLACERDGLGVRDDEVSASNEFIKIIFGEAVTLNAIYFLDLFNEAGVENATVTWFDGTEHTLAPITADLSETPGSTSGFLKKVLLPNITATWIKFSASGTPYSGNDYAVAAISAVPLPAALPLYGAGVALMGFLGWRRKRAISAA